MIRIKPKTVNYQPLKPLKNLADRKPTDCEYKSATPLAQLHSKKLNPFQKFWKTLKALYDANKR